MFLNMVYLFFLLIFFQILINKIVTKEIDITNIVNIAILRFKYYYSDINSLLNKNEFTLKDFKNYLFSNIYLSLEIGEKIDYINGSNQTLNLIINTQTNSLKLIHLKNTINFCLYNTSITNSFKLLYLNSKFCQIKEKVKIYYDMNLTKYKYVSLNFDNYNCLNDSLCGNAGISIYSFDRKEIGFFSQLQNIVNISDPIWVFLFSNEEEGIFIFGDMPHNYLRDKYNENNLISFYSKTSNYEITMDSIELEYKNKSIDNFGDKNDLIDIIISPDIEGIEFGNFYFKYIYKYFDFYIKKGICSTKIFDLLIAIIYCDGNNFGQKDIANFPKIIFKKYKLNFNISFENYELFYYKDSKYFFKIYKRFGVEQKFTLGRMILKKYLTVFNMEKKKVYLYRNNDNKDEKNNYKKCLNLLLFLLVMIIIFLIIGILIGKILFRKRKKHANELIDDNYEYITNKNDNINY